MIRVLGVDPSLSNLGMAFAEIDPANMDTVVKKVSLVKTSKSAEKTVRVSSDDYNRCKNLFFALSEAQERADIAFVEMPVGSQSADAMKSYGMCIMLIASMRLPVIQVSPTEVKTAAVGKKTATKMEIIEWAAHGKYKSAKGWKWKKVKGVYSLTKDNEHMADACGAIEAGKNTAEFRSAAQMFKSVAA